MENPTLPVLSLICNKQATTPMQNAVSNSCVRIESQGIAVPVCRTSLRHSTFSVRLSTHPVALALLSFRY